MKIFTRVEMFVRSECYFRPS